ncbi:hypothetical protein IFM89_009966 [Coptis chinensis]|uniref:Uncharacterized protein n=1 Tax=Coptis chinensis TaxID=261450 RepID=A0A835LPX7_9MAGN|nr:hypothetical protein IFM89_009966 [Coptis chinensis]
MVVLSLPCSRKKRPSTFLIGCRRELAHVQDLGLPNCVEVSCQESQFDHHVSLLRLLYAVSDGSITNTCHGVRNAIGTLQVAVELGCEDIIVGWKHRENIVKAVEVQTPDLDMLETMVKVIEVAAKVLEAIAYVDSTTINDDDSPPFKMDGELWQSLESAFVSMLLALPSGRSSGDLDRLVEESVH